MFFAVRFVFSAFHADFIRFAVGGAAETHQPLITLPHLFDGNGLLRSSACKFRRNKKRPENSRTADICLAIKKAAIFCRQQAIFYLLFTHFYNEILLANRTFCFHTIPVCLDFKLFFAMGASRCCMTLWNIVRIIYILSTINFCRKCRNRI